MPAADAAASEDVPARSTAIAQPPSAFLRSVGYERSSSKCILRHVKSCLALLSAVVMLCSMDFSPLG